MGLFDALRQLQGSGRRNPRATSGWRDDLVAGEPLGFAAASVEEPEDGQAAAVVSSSRPREPRIALPLRPGTSARW
jgi:hypothetical protein